MEDKTLYGKKLTFKLPSGYEVTIREQNGEDDDILSNPVDAKTFMNISKFIAGIVTDTDMTATRLLTPNDVQKMPSLDRYAIMINSRVFSLGEILDFRYTWDGPAEGQVRRGRLRNKPSGRIPFRLRGSSNYGRNGGKTQCYSILSCSQTEL